MHKRAAALLAFAFAAAAFGERTARAQACCVSTSAIFPARLADDEDGLVGATVKGSVVYGSFDPNRVFHGQPAGTSEIDLGQTLLATARIAEQPLQVNVSVPFVETFRSVPGTSDFGGGLGDLSLSIRWDVISDVRDPVVPGIAPLLSVTVPSGVASDAAHNPLGADATGLGGAELGTGLALEKVFGRTLFALTGTASFHGARTVHGIHSQLGPDLAGTLAASYTFKSGISLGGAFTYTGSWDSTIDGQDAPGSARALTELSLVAAVPLRGYMRLLGSLYFTPPISSLGQNENASVGLSLTLIYALPSHRPTSCHCMDGVCHPR